MRTTNHILLQKAKRTQVIASIEVGDGYYDVKVGAWMTQDGKELLVDQPNRDKPRTKKNDVETGEDLKSE